MPRHVAGAIEKQAECRLPIPPSPASFLVVVVKRRRQAGMHHEPHIASGLFKSFKMPRKCPNVVFSRARKSRLKA